MAKNLIENNMLFVIPSWGALLGYPTLGSYANQKVIKIHSDVVIFLSGLECSVTTDKGIMYYLFGLGYYFLKFELKSGRYITDNRQLTGLLLSDFVYDHLATSKNVTLEDDRDVIIAENLVKVPIDLSFKSPNKITFIKGALMRNLFIPHKDIFLEMMETVRKEDAYQFEKTGHMLLSAYSDFYNNILISPQMEYAKKVKYIKDTAGLNGFSMDVDKLMFEHFSQIELQKIAEKITFLKNRYAIINYDPMYLFSIVENASKIITSKSVRVSRDGDASVKMPKGSVFISAEDRMNSFIEWSNQFKRKTKQELEETAIDISQKTVETSNYDVQSSGSTLERNSTFFESEPKKQEKFQLRTFKSEVVERKPLPEIPRDNIDKILLYLKDIIENNYDLQSIGKAFEMARDILNKLAIHLDFIWEISKIANIYKKRESNLGLNQKQKEELLELVNNWIEKLKKKKIHIFMK